jgi:Glycosyltransferase family 87
VETSRVPEDKLTVEPGRRSLLTRRERLLLLAAAAALQVIAWLIILQLFSAVLKWGYNPKLVSPDVVHYADVATRVLLGRQWPYSGFPFEYPPLSILFFILPPVKGTLATYHHWFAVQMIAIDAITAVVTAAAAVRIWNSLTRPLAAAATLAVAVVAMGAIAIQVFDGAVALVLALAVLCLVYRRSTLAALTIGLGFSLKLMPIVVLPLVLTLARTRRQALWALLAGVAAAVAPFVPFLLHDEASVRSALFGVQIGRGLQIESVAASPYLIAEMIHHDVVTVTVPPGGSLTISGAGTGLTERLAPLSVLLLLVVVYWAVWHAREALRRRPEGVPVAALAAILAALCGNKVLSPQHLLWILPLVALCLVGSELLPRIAAILLLCAMVLTQVEFPGMYFRQIRLDPTPLVVISARNALLVAAFALTVIAVWRLRSADCAVAPGQVGPAVEHEIHEPRRHIHRDLLRLTSRPPIARRIAAIPCHVMSLSPRRKEARQLQHDDH